MNVDDQAQMYEHTLNRTGVYQMSITPYDAEESTAQREYKPPSTEHLGETARQFEWLEAETEALAAVTRGFGKIVDNARKISDESKMKPEPQRMTYTRKGKKRKTKRR